MNESLNEFTIDNYKFRIKRMNAIELLALRTTINTNSADEMLATYNGFLERIEVNVKDNDWLQVKQGNNFYPANIESNALIIEQLIKRFINYVTSVFTNSNK